MAAEGTEVKEESKFRESVTKLGDASMKVWEQSKKQANVIGKEVGAKATVLGKEVGAKATVLGKEVGAKATVLGKEVGARASTIGKQVSTKVKKTDCSFFQCFSGGAYQAANIDDEEVSTALTEPLKAPTATAAEPGVLKSDPSKALAPESAHITAASQPAAGPFLGQQPGPAPATNGHHQIQPPLQPPLRPAKPAKQTFSPLTEAVTVISRPQPPVNKGWRTDRLREQLAAAYGVPAREVQAAMDFAESESLAEVLCLTCALIGGPMEPDAFDEASSYNNNKEKLLRSYGDAATGLAGKPLTPAQRAVKERILKAAQASEETTQEEDLADFEADVAEEEQVVLIEANETARLRQKCRGLRLEEALQLLGVPGPGFTMTDIDGKLNPMLNIANRTPEQQAKRVAAYNVAVQLFHSQPEA